MGGEFGGVLLIPEILVIVVLLVMAGFANGETPGRILGLTSRQLLLGYVGGFIGVGLYGLINPFHPGKDVGFFLMGIPVAGFFLTIIGWPLIALLNRIGLLSQAGCVIGGIVASCILSASMYIFPHNEWCAENFFLCARGVFVEVFVPSLFVVIGFALCARLPIIRGGTRH